MLALKIVLGERRHYMMVASILLVILLAMRHAETSTTIWLDEAKFGLKGPILKEIELNSR